MNKQKFEMIKMIDDCDSSKAEFLLDVLQKAERAFEIYKEQDAQKLTGSIDIRMVREFQGASYGERYVGDMTTSGEGHAFLSHKFREKKTMKDFDWSSFEKIPDENNAV